MKNNFLKLLLVIISIAMVLSLFACGGGDEETTTDDKKTEQTEKETDTKGTESETKDTESESKGSETTETQSKATDPTDPTDPTEPTEPTEPTDPTEPTEPTEPTQTTEVPEPDPYEEFAYVVLPEDIYYSGKKGVSEPTVAEDGSYINYHGAGADDGWVLLIVGNSEPGQYLTIKYRLNNTNINSKTGFCSNVNDGPADGSNQLKNALPLNSDGEWHIAVYNMAEYVKDGQLNPNDDGEIIMNYFRFDFADKLPEEASIDIAFVGIVDSAKTVINYAIANGDKTVDVSEKPGSLVKYYSSTGEAYPAPSDTLDVFFGPEAIQEKVATGTNLGEAKLSKDKSYISVYGKGAGDGYFSIFSNNTEIKTGSYFVIKYRYPTTNENYKPTVNSFYVSTKGGLGNNSHISSIPFNADGEWHVALINLAANGCADVEANEDGTYTFQNLRIDIGDNLPENCCIDIAYVGLATSVEDAAPGLTEGQVAILDVVEEKADGIQKIYSNTLTAYPTFGTKADPHEVSNGFAIVVEPGATVYFDGKIAGSTMTVTANGIELTLGEDKFTPTEGAIVINPTEDAVFAITNTSEAAAACIFALAWPEGSEMNPQVITDVNTTVSLAANAPAYYLTWTADRAGTLTVNVSENCTYSINNLANGVTGKTYTGTSQKIVVDTGDVLVFVLTSAAEDIEVTLEVTGKAFPLAVFTPAELLAGKHQNIAGELIEEDGLVFYRCTPTDTLCEGMIVINSGETALMNVSKYVGIVYRSNSATNAFQIHLNDATVKKMKIDNFNPRSGTLTDGDGWHFALIDYSANAVDLSNGAGWVRFDILDDSAMKMGDTMDIAFLAFFKDVDSAHQYAAEAFGITSYKIHCNRIWTDDTNTTTNFVGANAATEGAVVVDLNNITFTKPADQCVGINAWLVTPDGWDSFKITVTPKDGAESELKDYRVGADAEQAVYDVSSGMKYGDDRGLGGSITSKEYFDLKGYEGQTVTVKVYGVTNYGTTVCVAIINNINLPN